MKKSISILLSVIICCTYFNAHSQIKQDSVFKQSALRFQQKLNLTDSVTNQIIVFRNQFILQKNDLNKKHLSLADRKNELTQIQAAYRKNIKKVLTNDQWQQYKQMELQVKNHLKQQMQNKKIKTIYLDDSID